jgi:hypothetical protein
VVEVRCRLRLTAEPLHEVRVRRELREEHLDRHPAVEQEVACEEHVRHAAAADALLDLVPVVEDDAFARLGHPDRPVRWSAARVIGTRRLLTRTEDLGSGLTAAPSRWHPPPSRPGAPSRSRGGSRDGLRDGPATLPPVLALISSFVPFSITAIA